jgi:hypothetical protein
MPAQVYQVLGLYLVGTIGYIAWVWKANSDLDKKLAKG